MPIQVKRKYTKDPTKIGSQMGILLRTVDIVYKRYQAILIALRRNWTMSKSQQLRQVFIIKWLT